MAMGKRVSAAVVIAVMIFLLFLQLSATSAGRPATKTSEAPPPTIGHEEATNATQAPAFNDPKPSTYRPEGCNGMR
ncbi:unnamed protein product [Linum trigynum]|uniref:Uncharacterized protein n=1 Tax=Linum trigynum TaxID=586398 RepID=A0AAV2DTT5_9ROSI